MKTLLGKKVGMTQIFNEDGAVVPVTVIEAGPEIVTQVKTVETDGYNAVQVGYEEQKPQRLNKPMIGITTTSMLYMSLNSFSSVLAVSVIPASF